MPIADSKLSALTELAASPAVGDEFYVRDISEAACCESKRITWSNIFLNPDLPGTLDVTGATTLDSTLSVAGVATMTSQLDVESYMAVGNGSALNVATTLMLDRDFSTGTNFTSSQLFIRGIITRTFQCIPSDVHFMSVQPDSTVINSCANHTLVTSFYVSEPVITETAGTAIEATTLHIADAPTEGCTNFALHVASGATQFGSTLDVLGLSKLVVAGPALDVQNTVDAVSNQVAIFRSGNRACAADGDEGYISFTSDDDAGNQFETARMIWAATDVTAGAQTDGEIRFEHRRTNTMREWLRMRFDNLILNENSNDINLRVEGNCNGNMLVIDGGLNVAAIGGGVVSGKMLSVYGDINLPQASLISTSCGDLSFGAAGNEIRMVDQLVLKITDTDGVVEGSIWYDASEDKLKFKTAAGVETITSA